MDDGFLANDKCDGHLERKKALAHKNITEELFEKLEKHVKNNYKESFDVDKMFLFFLHTTEEKYKCCSLTDLDFNDYVKHCETFHAWDKNNCRHYKKHLKIVDYDMSEYITKISKDHFNRKNYKTKNTCSAIKIDGFYFCDVLYCKKKYKSISGLKYHHESRHTIKIHKDD